MTANVKVSLPKQSEPGSEILRINGISIFMEIVAVRQTGFVFLIGFKEAPDAYKRMYGLT